MAASEPAPRLHWSIYAMNRHNDRSANYAETEGGPVPHEQERGYGGTSTRPRSSGTRPPTPAAPPPNENHPFLFDAGSLLRPASKGWYWLLLGTGIGVILGAVLGLSLWQKSYSASAQMMKYDPPVAS